MIISFREVFDLVLMTAYLGYLFKDIFRRPATESYEPLTQLKKRFNLENFKFAIIVTAPAIVLHELAHKFVAMAFGLNAIFFAFYHQSFAFMLAVLSIAMKMMGAPFLLIIPGFVGIPATTPLKLAIIAFAGPFMNLLLWLIPAYLLKHRTFNRKTTTILHLTKRINMFLFFFNMIPLGFFDGAKVFSGLFNAIFG